MYLVLMVAHRMMTPLGSHVALLRPGVMRGSSPLISPGYWPLIGWNWSRDLDTGLWLADAGSAHPSYLRTLQSDLYKTHGWRCFASLFTSASDVIIITLNILQCDYYNPSITDVNTPNYSESALHFITVMCNFYSATSPGPGGQFLN